MKEKKNILLHLYGDPDAEGDLRSLLKDPHLQEEHRALSEAKFRLDHMKRSQPDASSLDRIMAEASVAAASPVVGHRRGDRSAMRRFRPLRRLLIPAVSMAAVVVISIGLGLFSFSEEDARPNDSEFAAQDQSVEAESLLKATPINPRTLAPTPVGTSDPLLTWDDNNTIRNLYRRIETIRPTDLLDWGERSVPLESIPGSVQPGQSGLRQVGNRR